MSNLDLIESRIQAVRGQLADQGFDGLLVPRADAHQGEEVAPCDERLLWLTGFGGSAGYAVITQNEAHMFVDGRYTLQVQDQCPAPTFTHHSLVDKPPSKFISSDLGRIAFDPWLLTKAQRQAYKKADLHPIDLNPIDAVWKDRPKAKTGAIWQHPLELAGQASEEKRSEIANDVEERGATACILTLPDSIAWLLNIRGSDLKNTPVVRSFAILHADSTCDWFVESSHIPAEAMSEGLRLLPPDQLESRLKALKGPVLLDPSTAPVALFDLVPSVVEGPEPIIPRKARKNAAELKGIREAHKRDAKAMNAFLTWLSNEAPKGNLSELDAIAQIHKEREKQDGFISPSFDTISGAGPNGAIVHYRADETSKRVLASGELYLVDSGGQYKDGTTDITRTLLIGEARPDALAEYQQAYTLVLKGHIALSRIRFPKGTSGAALDVLARQFLWQAGLDYDHGTGHGVGACLNVHEGPARIAKPLVNSLTPLEPGMILSNEPGYYKAGAFGIRLENLVAVEECPEPSLDGRVFYQFETLSFVPFDDQLIDEALLTTEEQTWLTDYNAKCLEIDPAFKD